MFHVQTHRPFYNDRSIDHGDIFSDERSPRTTRSTRVTRLIDATEHVYNKRNGSLDRCCIKHAPASGSLSHHNAVTTSTRIARTLFTPFPSPSPLSFPFLSFIFLNRFFFFRFNRLCVSIDLLRPRSHTRGLYKHRNIQTHIVLFSSFFFFFLFLLIFVSFFFFFYYTCSIYLCLFSFYFLFILARRVRN